MVQGKIMEANADSLDGPHSIRLISNQPSINPSIFMPDALPAATLPIYPGLGQTPNMLVCMPSGLGKPLGMHYTVTFFL